MGALLAVFLLFTVALGVISVSAKDYDGFLLDIPKEFTVVTEKDDLSEFSKKVGVSYEELENYFSDGKYKLLAVNEDNTTQIKLSCSEDEFSKKIINFDNFKDTDLVSLGASFLTLKDTDAEPDITVVENNSIKFIKIVEAHKDSGGTYTVTQYITVVDAKTYKLSFFLPIKADNQLEKEVFNSFSVEKNNTFQFTLKHLFILLAIALFVTVIVLSCVNIFKSRKETDDN